MAVPEISGSQKHHRLRGGTMEDKSAGVMTSNGLEAPWGVWVGG